MMWMRMPVVCMIVMGMRHWMRVRMAGMVSMGAGCMCVGMDERVWVDHVAFWRRRVPFTLGPLPAALPRPISVARWDDPGTGQWWLLPGIPQRHPLPQLALAFTHFPFALPISDLPFPLSDDIPLAQLAFPKLPFPEFAFTEIPVPHLPLPDIAFPNISHSHIPLSIPHLPLS